MSLYSHPLLNVYYRPETVLNTEKHYLISFLMSWVLIMLFYKRGN